MNRLTAESRQAWGAGLLAAGLVATTPVDAWAYVDPGTGSYLFQIAAAGLLAGLYTIRHYWQAMTRALGSRSAAGSPDPRASRAHELD